jgi:uncharacterized lipoprotein YddW (UPF0748 family)
MLRAAVGLALLLCLLAPTRAGPPRVPEELRGVWVASVANLDWPSRKGLSTAQQQAELRAILDRVADLKFNVVIFQVRPAADALYASKLEPWSEYLTGAAGRAPAPYYDPLEFAVREAHARGLQLHAWFNPFRARHPSATSAVPADHVIRRRPDIAKRYGSHYWLNPTHPDVPKRSLAVILDVVRRYDIDGVHIDDYFYPYKEKDKAGKVIPFPDDDTWQEYRKAGGRLNRDDWRREAVNRVVERLYREVKAAKPWVRVGISPFGIWRPGHPPGIAGFDAYQEIDADSRRWLNEGWCDYFAPQLYWPIHQEKQSYPRLLRWWAGENRQGRHLCPGNYAGRVTGEPTGWPAREIVEQVRLTRAQPGTSGNIQFSMKAILHNTGGIADAIRTVYEGAALVPPMPWLKLPRPGRPTVAWREPDGGPELVIRPGGKGVRLYVVQSREAGRWTTGVQPAGGEGTRRVRFKQRPEELLITAVDRAGNTSEPVRLTRAGR